MATRSVGRVASARACLRSAAQYESYECVSKLESKIRSRSRKYNTGTAYDQRARTARVQYSMRHACSTRSLGHASVRKSCSNNSVHRLRPAGLLSIRRRWRAPCTLLRAAWLQLTLRRSSSSSVLTSERVVVLVELAGRRRRKRERKAHGEGTTRPRGTIAMGSPASVLLPPRSHAVYTRPTEQNNSPNIT